MLLSENSFIVHVLSRVMDGVADGLLVVCHCLCRIFFSCTLLLLLFHFWSCASSVSRLGIDIVSLQMSVVICIMLIVFMFGFHEVFTSSYKTVYKKIYSAGNI